MLTVQCWSCGTDLYVPHDRRERRAKVAGENTVDPDKRLCQSCWAGIKRVDVTRIKVRMA
jgi:hypothetical protein